MPLNQPDIKELKAIIDWVNLTQDVRELSLKYGDVELFISRNQHASAPQLTPAATTATGTAVTPPELSVKTAESTPTAAAKTVPSTTTAAPGTAAPTEVVLEADEEVVTAPMVGIFYAAPKPGAPAFVEVGTAVQPGTVLCIVEVMKLMNNIESTVTGTVTQILVANNDPVAFGQPIMVIKRNA